VSKITNDGLTHTTTVGVKGLKKFRHMYRPGHRNFLFSGQKNFEISGHFSGHQNIKIVSWTSVKNTAATRNQL